MAVAPRRFHTTKHELLADVLGFLAMVATLAAIGALLLMVAE